MKSRFSCCYLFFRLALVFAVATTATMTLALTPSIPKGDIVVELELVWDPPWHPDMMSEAAKLTVSAVSSVSVLRTSCSGMP